MGDIFGKSWNIGKIVFTEKNQKNFSEKYWFFWKNRFFFCYFLVAKKKCIFFFRKILWPKKIFFIKKKYCCQFFFVKMILFLWPKSLWPKLWTLVEIHQLKDKIIVIKFIIIIKQIQDQTQLNQKICNRIFCFIGWSSYCLF